MTDQDQEHVVECAEHGAQPETRVCQHIAGSLKTGKPVGFYWSYDGDQENPDAWCADCNDRLENCGGEWQGEAEEHLGVTTLCASCYFDVRRLCLGG